MEAAKSPRPSIYSTIRAFSDPFTLTGSNLHEIAPVPCRIEPQYFYVSKGQFGLQYKSNIHCNCTDLMQHK